MHNKEELYLIFHFEQIEHEQCVLSKMNLPHIVIKNYDRNRKIDNLAPIRMTSCVSLERGIKNGNEHFPDMFLKMI